MDRTRTRRLISRLAAALLLLATALLLAAPRTDDAPFAGRLVLNGPIGPAAAEYVGKALRQAQDEGAAAVVLQLDTPGGLADSMRDIVSAILASPVPVLCQVAPDGARAASAGTYILYACHVAAMAPASHLGAATPVPVGGGMPTPAPGSPAQPAKPDDATGKEAPADPQGGAAPADSDAPAPADAAGRKALNDAVAYIRALAELRGRNADWAEEAVRGGASLTAREAVAQNVADFLAGTPDELLQQADGRMVRLGGADVRLETAGLAIHDYHPGWRSEFLGIITNPTLAYLLLLAGIYGLVLEVLHPGSLFPGVAGAIALLTGLYALQLLPVNYAGLALMALGIGLLVAEMFVPAFGTLGLGGIAAFVLGSVMLFDTGVPGYAVNLGIIAGIATGAVLLLALVVWLVLRARRAAPASGDAAMLGAHGELLGALEPGTDAQALVHGERWRVRAHETLAAGTPIRVIRRDGLVLWVEASTPPD